MKFQEHLELKSEERMAYKYIERKNLWPFVLVTLLFSLWGFANAVTDPMVQAFKKVLEISNSQASWVQLAFYGGYFCMALPASLFVRRFSYKSGIMLGLALYGVGALLFYPAADYQQFWFFCLALYILTFGLAFLETTANPYILSLGSKESAARRLNLAQSFNPVGLLSGLLVAKFFVLSRLKSDNVSDFSLLKEADKLAIRSADLTVIKQPYVLIGLFVLTILIVFSLSKLPSFKDDSQRSLRQTWDNMIRSKKYFAGVVAQLFNVGAQIMCWTYIYSYAEGLGIQSTIAANYQFFALALFLSGRILNTYLLRYFHPANLLLFFSLFGCMGAAVTIFSHSIIGLYALVSLSFSMSLMFPTIYSLTLEDLDEQDAKIGASGLVMAIVGGALMPFIQAQIIDIGGSGLNDLEMWGVNEVHWSFSMPLICFVSIALFANYYIKNWK